MTSKADLLIEIGTEELPPKNLKAMMEAFNEAFSGQLSEAQFEFDSIEAFATPRRLALRVKQLADTQPDQKVERKGPSLKAALDDQGEPTRAAQGFMKSCGVTDISELEQIETEKGTWLVFRKTEAGKPLSQLIQDLLQRAVNAIPVERRMRWGARRVEFVRPVHWLVVLHGADVLPCELFDIRSGRVSLGHRFMSEGELTIDTPDQYVDLLHSAHVVADFNTRKSLIAGQLAAISESEDAEVQIDPALLDEVTALVEWPVALKGKFDKSFLKVPEEALISAMKEHQRYFHLTNQKGAMLPAFVTISNIESKNPDSVISGNERVILPRLTDAQFFYEQDKKLSVDAKLARLDNVVFQSELGSYGDKARRIEKLSRYIAEQIEANQDEAGRSALLAKTDLVSDMVNEFPDLQGIMGGYYAKHEGETETVCNAIREHYLPTSSGGDIPKSLVAKSVAIADKLDTLVGMFGIGQPPSGSRDPFALRRQTLGVVRMCVEGELALDLSEAIAEAIRIHDREFDPVPVLDYLADRLKNWYQDQGVRFDTVDAVIQTPGWRANLLETNNSIMALEAFRDSDQAGALVSANKRVANILKKLKHMPAGEVDTARFEEAAEHKLFDQLLQVESRLNDTTDHSTRLATLGELRENVDRYFDDVMVMSDDTAVRENRLATLLRLRSAFLKVADISLLQQ